MPCEQSRPSEAAPSPSDFDHWPALARVLWKELQASDAWRSHGWAHLTHRQLGEGMARTLDLPKRVPLATVKRWLTWLVLRGELARVRVASGETLPDGSVAWCPHWIVLPGDAMKARATSPLSAIRRVIADDHTSDRSSDGVAGAPNPPILARSAANDAPPCSPTPERTPVKDSRLSSLSGSGSRSEPSQHAKPMKLRTKLEEKPSAEKAPTLTPPVRMLAERLLRHYAEGSGMRVDHFRAASRAAVAACLDDLGGEDAAKEMRLRGVIDDAIAESRANGRAHPPIAFVFNLRHVRRRLERLAEAEHLAHKAVEAEPEGDMFTAGFDHALEAGRAALAKGIPAEPALAQARAFVESGRITEARRLEAYDHLARRKPAESPRPARRTAQDAPVAKMPPEGAAALTASPSGVYGPEDALRVLAALFGDDEEESAPVVTNSPSMGVPLTTAERAELESAQEDARARWARAG